MGQNMKITRSFILIILVILTASCGGSDPKITKIIVKSDSFGILLDTSDRSVISKLEEIFYEKEEKPDGGPDFKYFIDLTIDNNRERWQYSIEGYIRNFDDGHTMIYKLRDVAEFNKIANIK